MSFAGELRSRGYALTSAARLGWPEPYVVLGALSPVLAPDPRGPGKLHARDVIRYSPGRLAEAKSVAFTADNGEVIDDFSRFRLLKLGFGKDVVAGVLELLVPYADQQESGTLSADYFRYSPGVESPPHQDGFGDYVVIWVLSRFGLGGESFLIRDGQEVLSRALEPGEVLVFRDEAFLHGVRAMRGQGASRDVLIFITVRS